MEIISDFLYLLAYFLVNLIVVYYIILVVKSVTLIPKNTSRKNITIGSKHASSSIKTRKDFRVGTDTGTGTDTATNKSRAKPTYKIYSYTKAPGSRN